LNSQTEADLHIEGTGPETILMIHGWPDTYRLWDKQVEALKDRFRCVHFTLPGFDASKPRRAYSLDELTSFIKEVADQVSPDKKIILMLHDWGCVFGYEFYMRNPQRVSRIVGVDIGDKRSMQESITPRAQRMILAYQLWLAAAWAIGGKVGDRMTRYMARKAHCPSDTATISSCMNYPYFNYWFGGRNSIRLQAQPFVPGCPMLFLYGRRKLFLFHAKDWADELAKKPGSAVVEFDTGHWVMSEQPARFNEVVADWLGK
jgi:pimeloyl-ACP methyl ester carboxylesterase